MQKKHRHTGSDKNYGWAVKKNGYILILHLFPIHVNAKA